MAVGGAGVEVGPGVGTVVAVGRTVAVGSGCFVAVGAGGGGTAAVGLTVGGTVGDGSVVGTTTTVVGAEDVANAVADGSGGLSLVFEHAVIARPVKSARNSSIVVLFRRTLPSFADTRLTSPKHPIGDSGERN